MSARALPALVLAAGRGVRLDPLTRLVAKPAVPFGGTTLIEHVIDRLVHQGITELVVNLHHLPHTITSVIGDGHQAGARVRYSWEQPVVLGSGGGPRHALPLLDSDSFLIVNSDTLCDLDLTALIEEHRRSGAAATLAVIPNPAPDRYGGVDADADGRVKAFTRRGDAAGSWHFVGVQVANAAIFSSLADDVPAESVGGVYREAIAARPGSIRAWRTQGGFVDVGTPLDYFEAVIRPRVSFRGRREPRVDDRGHVVIWPGASVDPDSELDRCVVTTGVSVPRGFHASDALLLPASFVRDGDRCEIRDGIAVFPMRT